MIEATWSEDARRAFWPYVVINWPVGMWPLKKDSFVKLRLYVAVFEMVLSTVFVFQEIVYFDCSKINGAVLNVLLLGSNILVIVKIANYYYHRQELETFIVSAIGDWSLPNPIKYYRVMKEYEKSYKIFSYALYITMFLALFMYTTGVFFIDSMQLANVVNGPSGTYIERKKFLHPTSCMFMNVSDAVRWLVILNQAVQLIVMCVVSVGCDTLFVGLTTHLCGQFHILQDRFTAVGHKKSYAENRILLNTLITRHARLLERANLLESVYNKMIFAHLFLNIFIITVAGMNIFVSLKMNDNFSSARNVVTIFYMMLQSFLYMHVGQNLQNHGNELRQSVYSGSWYKLPTSLSKDLIFVLIRSNMLLRFTAGKFFDISLTTYVTMLKTSLSFLSVVRMRLLD